MSDRAATGPAAPFFILGSHGSGSTLLRLMLDSHERLAVPPETGVMRLVTAHRWVPFWPLGGGWHERLGLTDADLDAALGGFYGGLFERYAAQHGKQRWGDKTPFHVWHVDDIVRLFPDAVFVAIVRHPLGAVGSTVRRFDKRLKGATRQWLDTNRELARQAAVLGERLCLLRYEELIDDTETVLRELLDWLGEPWSPAVLQHHEVQRQRQAPKVAEGGTRTTEAVDAGRVDRWRKWLDDDQRQGVMSVTADWAAFFGYGADPGSPLERLTPDPAGSRRLVTGPDLAGRRSAFPGLDWSPPEHPRNDRPILPRGPRNRRRALRGPGGSSEDAARQLLERLPPGMQRAVRDARRGRRSRPPD